jgi:hypothetical protein
VSHLKCVRRGSYLLRNFVISWPMSAEGWLGDITSWYILVVYVCTYDKHSTESKPESLLSQQSRQDIE